MRSLLALGVRAREWRHDARFERATEDPAGSQAACLAAIVGQNAEASFGRQHRFGAVRDGADYRRRVPIRDYEGFRPYVQRMDRGEANVLTAEPLLMFAATSGTTAEPKLVPVTAGWWARSAALTRLWLHRALKDHPRCLDHRLLTVVGRAVEGRTAGGVPFGAMSGILQQGCPGVVRRHLAVPGAVAEVADHDTRYLLTARLALARPVSAVVTPNPTTLLRLAQVAATHADGIVRAVHDGTLGVPDAGLGGGAREVAALARIRAALRPAPGRARMLAEVLSDRGGLSPRHCWPDLALIGCWLGGSVGVHAHRLADHYGSDVAQRDLGLLASEGSLTVPVQDAPSAGVLAVHANFFEFVPEAHLGEPSPPVLLAHQLDDGGRYGIVLTGGNGLYRYDLNDVVEVRGFHNRTPKVAFLRKGGDMASITGEKLHLDQVEAALHEAARSSGVPVHRFRLVPVVAECRYDVLVEPERPAGHAQDADALLAAFDRALAGQNREYRSKRASRRLHAPRLFVMRSGWSERVWRAEVGDGRREAQYKWRSMCSEWDAVSRTDVERSLTLEGGAGLEGSGTA